MRKRRRRSPWFENLMRQKELAKRGGRPSGNLIGQTDSSDPWQNHVDRSDPYGALVQRFRTKQ